MMNGTAPKKSDVFPLPCYGGREGIKNFRVMTFDEAKALQYGQHIWVKSNDGSARRVKVNGQPRTWKTQPTRIEVPAKYGMYEYTTYYESDIAEGLLLVCIE